MPRAAKALDAVKQPEKKKAAVTGGQRAKSPAKPTKAAAKATKPTPPATAVTAPGKAADKPAKATAKAATERSPAAKVAKPPKKIEGAGAEKFFEEQRALLDAERVTYAGQAVALKAEADQLAQEMEPGDTQFDDESGEGAGASVDRERDLALAAQARLEVDEIDHALAKLASGFYGVCEGCGQPIPRARLKALPHARLCVACKSGGLSRR